MIVPFGEKEFHEAGDTAIIEEIEAADKGKKGEDAPKLVLMGAPAWRHWSTEKRLVELIKSKRTESKMLVRAGLEIRFTPALGDFILIV